MMRRINTTHFSFNSKILLPSSNARYPISSYKEVKTVTIITPTPHFDDGFVSLYDQQQQNVMIHRRFFVNSSILLLKEEEGASSVQEETGITQSKKKDVLKKKGLRMKKTELTRLWKALLAKEVLFKATPDGPPVEEEDAVALVLPAGLYWLHNPRSPVLFLRKPVFQINRLIEQAFEGGKLGVVVIGTPGIGKSWFGNFLLYKAAQQRRNVIFESITADTVYLFDACTRHVDIVKSARSNQDKWKFMDDYESLYIVDAGGKGIYREPVFPLDNFTVITASPNEKHYGQWKKQQGTFQLFLPPWEWNDLEAILPFTLPGFSSGDSLKLEKIRERFDTVGGIPRHILLEDPVEYKLVVKDIHGALSSITEPQLNALIRHDKNWEDTPNNLFVLQSEFPFRGDTVSVEIASPYIKELLPRYLDDNKLQILGQIIHATSDVKRDWGSFRGNIFERMLPMLTTDDKKFQIRELPSGITTTIQLPCKNTVPIKFKGEEYLKELKRDFLYLPESRSFKHIDGFILSSDDELIFLQCTTSPFRVLPNEESMSEFISGLQKAAGGDNDCTQQPSSSLQNFKLLHFIYVVDKSVFSKFYIMKLPREKDVIQTYAGQNFKASVLCLSE